jgi:hypothetical protein
MCHSGGGGRVLRKYAELWNIDADHFDPYASQRGRPGANPVRPLKEILVRESTYSRSQLKQRLYREGLLERHCVLCGQDEMWLGHRMSLILDHVNGVSDDNRIENLRIVCPNCAATLDTHCGRNAEFYDDRECLRCSKTFSPRYASHRYCSLACGSRWDRTGKVFPSQRRVERPPIDELLALIGDDGYEAVGRRYGVSGNAIRKWVRVAGANPPPGKRPTPPVRRALDDDAAREALRLLAAGVPQGEIADRFGVSQSCIKDLSRGRSYRHLQRTAA